MKYFLYLAAQHEPMYWQGGSHQCAEVQEAVQQCYVNIFPGIMSN